MKEAYQLAKEAGYKGRLYAPKLGAELSDPEFWRCLGKSLGWGEIKVSWFIEGAAKKMGLTKKLKEVQGIRPEWQYRWHRFTDHLAEGKEAEEFFTSLIK